MIRNLFSSFDPSSNRLISLNWASIFIILVLITTQLNVIIAPVIKLLNLLFKSLYNEFKIIVFINKPFTVILVAIFVLVMINNFIGLFPYIFTATRHLSVSMVFSLPVWVGLILFGWINYNKNIFAHLVPQRTPVVLMPFMVLIERISNTIRPLTLAIRLSANIIAGHLLMTLLGNQLCVTEGMSTIIAITAQFALVGLEMAVSIIQAYVFSVLLTLYIREVGNH